MKSRRSKKLHKPWKSPTKWAMFGLVMGVVLATVGSVAALNGWFGGGGSIPEDTLTRGLVGYWPMDEGAGTTAYDSSDNGNHGTLTGPSWGSSTTTCKVGGCLSFDGTNDYVDAGSGASFDITNAITLSAWIKTSISATRGSIVGRYNGGGNYLLEVNQNDGLLRFEFASAVGFNDVSNTSVANNSWTQAVVTYDGSNVKWYINGNLDRTVSKTGSITSGTGNVEIGRLTGGTQLFTGLIDEVRIYNRALSAEEVRYHYNRGGPVAHWKFDEGEGRQAFDSSGQGNNGTLVLAGSATSSAWVAGKSGSALSFDGVDDYVDIGNNKFSQADFAAGISLEAWIKVDTLSATIGGQVQKRILTIEDRFNIDIDQSTSKLQFHIYDTTDHTVYSDNVISAGQWYHLVGTWDSVTMKIFVNGIQQADTETSNVATIDAVSRAVVIGHDWNKTVQIFNGLIDDVRIYNYARTPEEIRLDYNSGFAALFGRATSKCKDNPGSCMTQGLVGYWPMDEGAGTTAYDSSDNGNHGTLSGPSWGGAATTCKVAGCLSFDGTNDYVRVADSSSLDGLTFTVEMWVKFFAIVNDDYVLRKGTNAASTIFTESISGTNFTSHIGGNPAGIVFNAPTIGQWYHYVTTVVTSGGNSVITTYVDGVKQNSGGTTELTSISGTDLFIGSYDNTASFGNEVIDEVKIYNRALSAEEVRYHYNRGGPVAHWPFDSGSGSVLYDKTESNNDGTLYLGTSGNTATSSAWVSGKSGSALSFDGVDDYVSVADSNSLDITDVITISAWIKTGDYYSGTQGTIVAKDAGNPVWGAYDFDVSGSPGYLKFAFYAGGAWQGTILDTSEAVTDNQWHYVAVIYDKNNYTYYVDGVKGSSYAETDAMVANTGSLSIGSNIPQPTYDFNGLIDDVRIYNYARTPDEIRLDYNSGFAALFGRATSKCKDNPGSCMTQGLVGYWPMDEGAGTVAYDSSNYANHGTTSGGPQWAKGKVGGALSFDGSNDYVDLTNSATLQLSEFTIEAWVKNNINDVNERTIVARGTDTTNANNNYWIFILSNQFRFRYGDGSTGTGIDAAAGSAPVGTWTHVAATFKSDYAAIYVNGVQSGETQDPTIVPNKLAKTTIGAGSQGTDDFGNGLMDEVRIYNRALSAEEVRYHYNRGGPVAQWPFNEGSGSVLYDKTESNNDGTLYLGTSGNTATSSAWVSGKFGSALSFDGTDDYVSVPDTTGSVLDISSAITLAGWVYPRSFPTSDTATIITKSGSYYLSINTSGQAQAYLDGTTNQGYHAMNTSLALNKWNYAVWTYDGSNVKLYLNGVLDKIVTDTGSITAANWIVGVGAEKGAGASQRFFNGMIDDVRIYNYARSPAQILQDYNGGMGIRFK